MNILIFKLCPQYIRTRGRRTPISICKAKHTPISWADTETGIFFCFGGSWLPSGFFLTFAGLKYSCMAYKLVKWAADSNRVCRMYFRKYEIGVPTQSSGSSSISTSFVLVSTAGAWLWASFGKLVHELKGSFDHLISSFLVNTKRWTMLRFWAKDTAPSEECAEMDGCSETGVDDEDLVTIREVVGVVYKYRNIISEVDMNEHIILQRTKSYFNGIHKFEKSWRSGWLFGNRSGQQRPGHYLRSSRCRLQIQKYHR